MNFFTWLATFVCLPILTHLCVHTHTRTQTHYLLAYLFHAYNPFSYGLSEMKKICMGCSVHKVSYSKTQEIFLGLPACLIFLIICFICHVLPVLDFVWFDIGGFVRSPSTNVSFFFYQIWKFRFLIILSLFLILVLSIPSNLVISLSLSLKNCCVFIWITNFMSDFSEIIFFMISYSTVVTPLLNFIF